MASLSYGRIFCLEFQKIDGTYQRYNHYFEFFLLEFYFFLLKGRRPISRPKIENFTQTKCYLFSILYTLTKLQDSRFNNFQKIANSVDPIKYSVPSIF